MRVNQSGNNPVQKSEVSGAKRSNQAASTQESQKAARAYQGGAADGAKAEISAKGKEFAKAKAVASETPDVREEKIAELKRRIAAGTYKVDAEAISERMVDDHLKAGIG